MSAVVIGLLAFTGCSSSQADRDTSTAPPEATDITTAPSEATDTAADSDVSSTAVSIMNSADQPQEAPLLLPGLNAMDLLTSESGGGIRPLLQWSPVAEADHYGLYVYSPDESIYWAWRGVETEVYVGGAVQIDEERPGPSVIEGMSWAVVAYDPDLVALASSPIQAISP